MVGSAVARCQEGGSPGLEPESETKVGDSTAETGDTVILRRPQAPKAGASVSWLPLPRTNAHRRLMLTDAEVHDQGRGRSC